MTDHDEPRDAVPHATLDLRCIGLPSLILRATDEPTCAWRMDLGLPVDADRTCRVLLSEHGPAVWAGTDEDLADDLVTGLVAIVNVLRRQAGMPSIT